MRGGLRKADTLANSQGQIRAKANTMADCARANATTVHARADAMTVHAKADAITVYARADAMVVWRIARGGSAEEEPAKGNLRRGICKGEMCDGESAKGKCVEDNRW